ncbi:MAG: peptide deformylase [Endomicrobium sp.]|jgi:peptide deformylase|nr:peptide deformylase [Endomicrobium sp.]
MKLKIIKYGNPILRKKSEIIYEISDYLRKLSYDMLETMYAMSGIGLAAPQVGILLRICVIDISLEHKSSIIMLNPKIILVDNNKIYEKEGCLSLPGFYESIKRFKKISVDYIDLDGRNKKIEVTGLIAKVMQHEIDHLDAKIFVDYLPNWKRKIIIKKIKRKIKIGKW